MAQHDLVVVVCGELDSGGARVRARSGSSARPFPAPLFLNGPGNKPQALAFDTYKVAYSTASNIFTAYNIVCVAVRPIVELSQIAFIRVLIRFADARMWYRELWARTLNSVLFSRF